MKRLLDCLSQAEVGQEVTFNYHGGSTPGEARTVRVMASTTDALLSEHMLGLDIVQNEICDYRFDRASDVYIITDDKPVPNIRVRHTTHTFVEARKRLHNQIDELNGEDLAEILAEIEGDDNGNFDASTGEVTLLRSVLIPHCKLNADKAGLDWVNEDGEVLTSQWQFLNNAVRLYLEDNEVPPVEFACKLFQHLGLTIQ